MSQTCPNCGRTIEPGVVSCIYCGNLILEGEDSVELLESVVPLPDDDGGHGRVQPASSLPPALARSSSIPPALGDPLSSIPPALGGLPDDDVAGAGHVPPLPPLSDVEKLGTAATIVAGQPVQPPSRVPRPPPPSAATMKSGSGSGAPLPPPPAELPELNLESEAPIPPPRVQVTQDPDPKMIPKTQMEAPARVHSGLTGLLVDSSHRPEQDEVQGSAASRAGLPEIALPEPTSPPGFQGSPAFVGDGGHFSAEQPSPRPAAQPQPRPAVDEAPDSEPPPRRPEPTDPEHETLAAINEFGDPPSSPLYDIPYFVRVYLRRRQLTVQLHDLIAERERADRKHVDALCEVGELLYMRRDDATLSALSRRFAVVANADADVDRHQHAGAAARLDAVDRVDALEQQLSASHQVMEPLQRLADRIEKQMTQTREELAAAEQEAERNEQQMEKIRASEDRAATDDAQLAFLISQRDDVSRRMLALESALEPRAAELSKVRLKLSRQREAVGQLVAERDRLRGQMEREQRVHSITAGTARGELRSALAKLGEEALRQQLTHYAQAQLPKVEKRAEELLRKRNRERLHRKAMAQYDPESYKRGMYELVGGTGLLMLTLLYQIFIW